MSRGRIPKAWRTLELRPWRRGDEEAFKLRADMLAEAAVVAWNFPRQGPPGPTWTLVRAGGGEVVGMGGGVEIRRGDWQAWAWLAPLALHDWPSAIACALEVIRQLERDWGAKNTMALGRSNFPGAALVLERLGFTVFRASNDWPGYTIFWRESRRRRRRAA